MAEVPFSLRSPIRRGTQRSMLRCLPALASEVTDHNTELAT